MTSANCGQSDEIDGIGQNTGPFLGREWLNDSSSQKKRDTLESVKKKEVDFNIFKAQILEEIKAGKPLFGKMEHLLR